MTRRKMVREDKMAPDLDELVLSVHRLVAEDRLFEAKLALVNALQENPQCADLLQELASIENKQGDHAHAAAHLADAVKLAPANTAIVRDHVETMRKSGLYSKARSTVGELPDELRSEPPIRAVLGDVYRAIGWHAHAFHAYGNRRGLPARARYYRFASWLRTGGPLRIYRSRLWATERVIDDVWWAKSTEQRATLTALDLPARQDISGIGPELDACLLRLLTARHRLEAARQRANSSIWQLGFLGLAWLLSLALIYIYSRPIPDFSTAAYGAFLLAEIAAIIIVSIDFVVRRYTAELQNRLVFVWKRSLVVAFIGIAVLYIYRTSVWSSFAGLIAVVAGITYAMWKGPRYSWDDEITSLAVRHPREYILVNFLDALYEAGNLDKKNDLRLRTQWMTSLQNAAWAMERCLPHYFADYDPGIRGWIVKEATDAAGATRILACHIGLPKEGTWDQLMADLRHNARMVIMGDFRSLQPEGPSPSSQGRGGRQRAIINILLVAAALVLLVGLVGILLILRDETMVKVAETTAVTTFVALLAGVLIKPLQEGANGRQTPQDGEPSQ